MENIRESLLGNDDSTNYHRFRQHLKFTVAIEWLYVNADESRVV